MEDCTRCGTYRPDFRFPITHLRHKTWSHAAARRAAPGRWSRPPSAKNPSTIFLQIGAQPRTTWTRTTVKLPPFSPRHSFLIAEKPLFGACFGYRPHPPSMENKEHWTQPGCRNPLDFRRLGRLKYLWSIKLMFCESKSRPRRGLDLTCRVESVSHSNCVAIQKDHVPVIFGECVQNCTVRMMRCTACGTARRAR